MRRRVLVAAFVVAAAAWPTSHLLAQSGGDEQAPSGTVQATQARTATPKRTLAYFTPQDSDGTATVLSVFNTTGTVQPVEVVGYGAGVVNLSLDVAVDPGMVHLVTDSLVASPPPSWANAVLVNFTDVTEYASLALPPGVFVDGYVVFNSGTGTIDPRADQGAIPLRFSGDGKYTKQ